MPKKIYSDFSGGLSNSDKNALENQYYAGRDVDIFRNYGYLTPGFSKTEITMTDMTSTPFEIIYDSTGQYAYLFGTARIWGVNVSNNTQLAAFGGASTYVTLAGLSSGRGLLSYITEYASTRALLAYNGTHNDIGMGKIGLTEWNTAGNWTAEWHYSFTTSYLNAGNRDIIDWRSYVWYTNGRYVGRFDPSVNPVAAGSFNDQFLDLGSTWTSDLFFTTNNYLGVVGHKTDTSLNYSRLYLFNLAGDLVQLINLENISINSVANKDGTILFFINDGSQNTVATLQQEGVETIKVIQHDLSGTLTSLGTPNQNAITHYKNGILFGAGGLIMNFGRRTINDNFSLSCPMSMTAAANSSIGAIKSLSTSSPDFYVTYLDGVSGDKKLIRLNTAYSSSASYKAPYNDLGQKAVINYIEVYFKPMTTGDSLTIGLDTNYGTSHTLQQDGGVISKAKDGTVSYKKFDIGGIECHAFRPTISWTSGGVAVGKMVVDYSFIDN